MNPAKLDTKITLSRKVTTHDASGGPASTLEQIAQPWAERTEQGSRVFRSYGTLHEETTTLFKIRFLEVADRDIVITCAGENYELTQPPVEVDGRKAYLLIQARRVR